MNKDATTEDRDPLLQALFESTSQSFADEPFVDNVLNRTTSLQYRFALSVAAALVACLVGAWLLALPLQQFGILVAQVLSNPLVDLGEGWVAFLLTPVNTVAGLLAILAKILRMGWKWIRGSG